MSTYFYFICNSFSDFALRRIVLCQGMALATPMKIWKWTQSERRKINLLIWLFLIFKEILISLYYDNIKPAIQTDVFPNLEVNDESCKLFDIHDLDQAWTINEGNVNVWLRSNHDHNLLSIGDLGFFRNVNFTFQDHCSVDFIALWRIFYLKILCFPFQFRQKLQFDRKIWRKFFLVKFKLTLQFYVKNLWLLHKIKYVLRFLKKV